MSTSSSDWAAVLRLFLEREGKEGNTPPMCSFSSSSFFYIMFLRFRAFSSLRTATSEAVNCAFLLDPAFVSNVDGQCREEEKWKVRT
jgi:hypothetical protein